MADPLAEIAFASWLRRGLAAGISRADGPPAGASIPRTTTLVQLTFNPNGALSQIAQPRLTLLGPGDIAGLDPRTVVRVFPPGEVNDAEAAYFAGLEFDQADLPWRYTPARANTSDQLRPWFTLVVLKETAEEITDYQPASASQKLAHLTTAVQFLPDLDQVWAWSHAQAKASSTGGNAADIKVPGRVVARFFSPRRLDKNTAYRAFLVPTFARGRIAGLGQPLNDAPDGGNTPVDALAPAWLATDSAVTLPVYHEWRFQTGSVGSFQELAAKLGPTQTLDETVGRRHMDVSVPGLLASVRDPTRVPPQTFLAVGGGLRSAAAIAAEATDAADTALQADLDNWTTRLGSFIRTAELAGVTAGLKVVVPPLYGRWYAHQKQLDRPPSDPDPEPRTNPPWFYRLNRHPRYRVAAALGTRVVQREQQSLMASAWRQIDKVLESNREKNSLQTARELLNRLFGKQINTGFLESKFTVLSEFLPRVLYSTRTAYGVFQTSALRVGFLDPQWRRLSSPQGRVGRRLGLHLLAPGTDTKLFQEINAGSFEIAPRPATPADTHVPRLAFRSIIPGGLDSAQISALESTLSKDQLNFRGLQLFWVARHHLREQKGQYWWLAHRALRMGLELCRHASDSGRAVAKLAEKLRSDTLEVADLQSTSVRTATFTALETRPTLAQLSALPLPEAPGVSVGADNPAAQLFREAAVKLTTYRHRSFVDPPPIERPRDLGRVLGKVIDGVQPDSTLPDGIRDRHLDLFPERWKNPDKLERILAAPEFPQPMCLPLQALSEEWILPGLANLPENTIAGLFPDRAFIEAYMVGLNHEMTRELLWNEYPIDQRNTYFFQFWDSRGFVVGGADVDRGPDGLKDIKQIRKWGASQLGSNTSRNPATEQLVLVVRGELVKNFPNFIAYAAQAKDEGGLRVPDDSKHRHPAFQGRIGADVSYHGFDLTRTDIHSGLGWFFILQEQVTAPRFGIQGTPPPADQRLMKPTDFKNPDASAASTAAQVAIAAFKPPARIAIHGTEIIP